MTQAAVHNPDRYMSDLRQILSQGKKRVGFLIGAGAPASIKVNEKNMLDSSGPALIPGVEELTNEVIDALCDKEKSVINQLISELGENPNIEDILTRVRKLSQAIGNAKIHDMNGKEYGEIADHICYSIGSRVNVTLPVDVNPYIKFINWIGGTHREYPIEIFSPNYDLLFEEAFERAKLPYFDGFSGSHKPFFDPVSIAADNLPARWSRLWKIHGSLGWKMEDNMLIRTGDRDAANLIYPEHMKYDQIRQQPYSALFDRLREFLATPDSLLICSGFSFSDAHITALLEESLSENAHTAVFAFQYHSLSKEKNAKEFALKRSNANVYAPDEAVISGTLGKWILGNPPNKEWYNIRATFWNESNSDGSFLLGDFEKLTHFIAHSHLTVLRQEMPHLNQTADIGKEGGNNED